MSSIVADAAARAVEAAGFINVQASTKHHGHELCVHVRGDCPCGLGASQFAVRLYHGDLASPAAAECVAQMFEATARRHIEDDRAEGRWVDA